MISSFYGTKIKTSSVFSDKGNRVVVSHIKADPLTVTQIKSAKKDGYWSIQCAVSTKSNKSLNKPQKIHLKGAKLSECPGFLREIKLPEEPKLKVGDQVNISEVFSPGDKVKVTGVTKGRGFAGVIKRWGFHGGPRTHGQSDRERSPGSIGQRTDPGRVWKGKKMPGHYGTDTQTIRGLQVISINKDDNQLLVTGTIPGHIKALVKITKTGQVKRKILLTGSATSATKKVATAPAASSEPTKAKSAKK